MSTGIFGNCEFARDQRWELEEHADGTFSIWNVAAGKVLDADGFNVQQNGCRIQLWDYNGDPQQRWRIEAVAGLYRIVNVASGKVLDAHAPDVGVNGCRVQLWEDLGSSNQLFGLVEE